MAQDFCKSTNANVGMPDCDVRIGKPMMTLFSQTAVVITEQQAEELQAYLEAAVKDPSYMKRLLPFSGIKQLTDNSTAPTEGTLNGYGYSEPLADGSIVLQFEFPATICRLATVNAVKGLQGYAFIIDDKGVLYGRKVKGGLRGFQVDSIGVDNTNATFADGQNVKTAKLILNFGSDTRFIDRMGAYKVDVDLEGIKGVQTIEVDLSADSGTMPVNAKVATTCGNINLFDLYSAELASAALWNVVDRATGTPISGVTITANAAEKSFNIAAQGAGGKKLSIYLADIDALEAAGIVGYEQIAPAYYSVS